MSDQLRVSLYMVLEGELFIAQPSLLICYFCSIATNINIGRGQSTPLLTFTNSCISDLILSNGQFLSTHVDKGALARSSRSILKFVTSEVKYICNT